MAPPPHCHWIPQRLCTFRAPSSRWGLWGGVLSQPEWVRRKRTDTSSPWAGHGHSRGHRTPPGALPTATIGVSRLRALTGWALGAQLAPSHCPHRAGRTGRSQEPGRRLCQPRGCCCLPPPAVTATRSCTHDSLPLSCGAPRPSRGGAGSPTAMKGQNSYLPNSSSSSSSPSGPKARGYGSCPTPQGMLRAPMAGMDWRLPWPGAGGGHSASSGSRLLALTRTRFLEKGWMETLLPPQPRPFLKT